jgi:molecular chaperone GrpE
MSASEQEGQGPVIRDRRRIDPVTGQPRQQAQPAEQSQPGEQARAGEGSAGQTPRGSGPSRPGKHAVSKPGSLRTEAAGAGAASTQGESEQPESSQPGAASEPGPGKQPGPPGANNQQSGGPDVAAKLAERTADLQRVQAEYANYRKRVERDRVAVREHALASVVAELLPVLDDIGRAREHDELTGGFKAVAESLGSAASKLGLTTFGEAGEPFDPNVHEALMHSYSPDVTEPTCVQILQPGYKVGERILRPARVAVAEPTDPAGVRTAGDADDDNDADHDGIAGQAGSADEPDESH